MQYLIHRYFCWKNVNSFCKCKSFSHLFSKNISLYAIFDDQSFKVKLTDDIIRPWLFYSKGDILSRHIRTKNSPYGYAATAGGVQEIELNPQIKINIVHPSVKSRSKSVTFNGCGQGALWQMGEWSFISLEALVFGKQSLIHRLNFDDTLTMMGIILLSKFILAIFITSHLVMRRVKVFQILWLLVSEKIRLKISC